MVGLGLPVLAINQSKCRLLSSERAGRLLFVPYLEAVAASDAPRGSPRLRLGLVVQGQVPLGL
jgi:hypothetical protein